VRKTSLVALAALVALTGCPEEPKSEPKPEPKKAEVKPLKEERPPEPVKPPEPPKPAVAEEAQAMQKLLDATANKIHEAIVLPGRTMPGCKEEWRARLYLSDKRGNVAEFINVNRYATEAEATGCYEEYKSQVVAAGPAAWDRLGPLISTNGRFLYQFSEVMTDAARRDAVLGEVKKVAPSAVAPAAPAPAPEPVPAPSAPAPAATP